MKPKPFGKSEKNNSRHRRYLANYEPTAMNNGFWDRPPEERCAIMENACERGGVTNFFDLTPEERGAAYGYERD